MRLKQLASVAVTGLLSMTTSASAWDRPDQGRWGVEVEYLYLLPMVSQSYYAVDREGVGIVRPRGSRYNNELDFQSAYRIGLGYSFCENSQDLRFLWTHLPHASGSDTATGSLLTTQGPPSLFSSAYVAAASEISLDYHALDVLFGFWRGQFPCLPCLDMGFQAGLQYARFKWDENLRYTLATTTVDSLDNKSRLWGIGPELACTLLYEIPFCQQLCGSGALSLAANVRGGVLVSKYKTSLSVKRSTNEVLTTTVDDQNRWDFVSFWDLRLGLNYRKAFRCFCADVEVGYELISYHNAINRIAFGDDLADGNSFDNYSDANFQGPYVALGFSF